MGFWGGGTHACIIHSVLCLTPAPVYAGGADQSEDFGNTVCSNCPSLQATTDWPEFESEFGGNPVGSMAAGEEEQLLGKDGVTLGGRGKHCTGSQPPPTLELNKWSFLRYVMCTLHKCGAPYGREWPAQPKHLCIPLHL